MTYDIRPLSFGEILDRAFRVFLDNFALLFAIAATVWIPSGIILATSGIIGRPAANVLNLLFLMVAGPVMQAALTVAVAEAYLDRPIAIVEAYRAARPIIMPLLGTYLLVGVVLLAPGLLIGGTYFIAKPLFVIALIIYLVVMFYFIGCWSLTGPVMIVERRFGMSAPRRSRELVLGSWWRTVGILFVASIITTVPAAAVDFVWAFIPVIGVILTAATQAITSSYQLIALVIYYFDRRCRTEDFDLRLLAEQVRSQTAPTASSSSLA
jgi:hypothetical protein